MAKRFFDIVFASCMLMVTCPLILISACLVKITCGGPVLYRAKRAGRGGKPFNMLKLRTMRESSDTPDRKITAAQDDRITPIGRVLRRFKIDELPQFWNVLRGDMSVVGPRPEDWDIVENYYTAQHRRTLEVRPGIVSLAEVRWYPDLTYHDPPPDNVSIQEHYVQRHMPAQLAEALRYVERHDLWLDLKVISQVIFCLIVYSWLPCKRRPLPVESEAKT
jgi:lipopolysaccharide/colanic/teichoic acid biosynthesis glycosyltransferase